MCVCECVREGVGCAQWKVNSVHVTFLVFPTFTNQGTVTHDDERAVNIPISLALFLFLFPTFILSLARTFSFHGIAFLLFLSLGSVRHMTQWWQTMYGRRLCCFLWMKCVVYADWTIFVRERVRVYVYLCICFASVLPCTCVLNHNCFLLFFPLCWFTRWITALC